MKYAEGDIYHALRGQVVETSKHAEQWRQAEQYEATQRAKMGDGKRGDSNGPAGKISGMSGAQQRNMKNSEGTVDWAEKFSTDTRYSHVDFARQGTAKKRKEEGVDIDAIAAAAKAFAAQKAQQSSISTNDPDATSPSGEGAPPRSDGRGGRRHMALGRRRAGPAAGAGGARAGSRPRLRAPQCPWSDGCLGGRLCTPRRGAAQEPMGLRLRGDKQRATFEG